MRDSMKITRDFIRDKCKIREPVAIPRAHRIPTRRTNDAKNPRPMIALFLENNDKMMVKEAVKKLPKDSGFRAYDDLPKPIHEARQRLNDDDVKHRRAGRDAWVIFPAKLIVDGDFVREEPVIPRQNPRAERRQRSPRREQPVSRDYSSGNRGERRQASPRPANRHNSDQSANAWQDPPHRRRGYGSRRGRGGGGFRGGRDHSDRSPIRDPSIDEGPRSQEPTCQSTSSPRGLEFSIVGVHICGQGCVSSSFEDINVNYHHFRNTQVVHKNTKL